MNILNWLISLTINTPKKHHKVFCCNHASIVNYLSINMLNSLSYSNCTVDSLVRQLTRWRDSVVRVDAKYPMLNSI